MKKTLCQRCYEDSITAGPSALARRWAFRAKKQGRNSDLGGRPKSELRPWWETEVGIPTLVGGAGSAGGFYAGQAARVGGFYAGQVARPDGGFDAKAKPPRCRMTV